MVYSMTGYGKSSFEIEGKTLSIEIQSVNSKSLDLNLRIPYQYKSKEIDLRKLFNEFVIRGKVDAYYSFDNLASKKISINKDVVKGYIKELQAISNISDSNFLQIAMNLPDVLLNEEKNIIESEWELVLKCSKKAIIDFNEFRKKEGNALYAELQSLISNISFELKEIEAFEKERMEKVRERLLKQLANLQIEYDEQRFHQELIYYIEKQDITEEKTRLSHHLQFFIDTLGSKEIAVGKKLNFIAQEMGREINTLGYKANHLEIQKKVVQMKDDLEKIKEQCFNIL